MKKIFNENPININYNDTLENLKKNYNRYQHFIYICKNCGKLENRTLNYIKNLNFLCKSCNYKQNLIEKYGSIENANKEILQKRKNTNKIKFGVEFPLQNEKLKSKAKETCIKHFGVDCSLKSNIVKQKSKETLQKKYNVNNAAYIPNVRNSKKIYNIKLNEEILPYNLFFILGKSISRLSEANNICGIYKITNLVNNKLYIGSSKNIGNRWHSHRNSCLWKKLNSTLYNDFEKYGLQNFKFDIIEICNESELLEKENFWQNKLLPEYNKKFAISNRTYNNSIKNKAISGIYLLLNNITNDFYIGSSKNINERLKQHFSKSAINKPYSNKKLYNDIISYGKENFSFEILEECNNNLKELEQKYIDYFCPTYNIDNAKSKSNNYFKNYYSLNKEKITKYKKDYYNHICNYSNKIISFRALARQFQKLGIQKPYSLAKKYIVK